MLKDTMVLAYTGPPTASRSPGRWCPARCCGPWTAHTCLSPKGSGTDVTYELSVDLVIPMIGLLKRKAERRLTDTALKDLKKRVEAD